MIQVFLMSDAQLLASSPLTNWSGPLGLPDFAAIDEATIGAVFDAAFAAHLAEIETIANNPAAPTIELSLRARRWIV
jgi:peptidyl-dipeptidase Dcp